MNNVANNLHQPIAIYSNNKGYQMLCKDKYCINNQNLLFDDKLLLLLYTYEWFKIPEDKIYNKVLYHPYLIQKDFDLLNNICESQTINTILITVPIFIANIFIFRKLKKNNTKQKFISLKASLSTIAISSLLYSLYFRKNIDKYIIQDKNLKKYLKIDVDYKMITEELKSYPIDLV